MSELFTRAGRGAKLTILSAGFIAFACGDDWEPSPVGTGGTSSTGGVPGAGAMTASGGASGGGAAATGGFTASGGFTAGGGSTAPGGTTASGGSSATGGAGGAGSGGDAGGGAGGASSGGTGSGGDTGSGGNGNTGGQTSQLIGWASVSGDGVSTTTGGGKGQTVVATSASQLQTYAESADPLVITFRGTLRVPRLNVASNKTLRGLDSTATIEGGIRIRGTDEEPIRNVIVQNVRVNGATSDVDGDAMSIYFAHHVWVDHAEIYDGPDGNLDIVHASNWVTVSWTKFRYTSAAPDPDHKFSNLVGHSDGNASEDEGRLKLTFHHCWWAEGVIERMPRVRFGNVHVFNSYYSSSGNNYAVGAGRNSHVLVENNVFEGINDAHIFYDNDSTAGLLARGNEYPGSTGKRDTGRGTVANPTYQYTLEGTSSVENSVKAGAGPR